MFTEHLLWIRTPLSAHSLFPANGYCYQVPEEETEVQSGYVTCLGTHSWVKTGRSKTWTV